MKKGLKIFWICLLVAASLSSKALMTCQFIEWQSSYSLLNYLAVELLDMPFERVIYAVDAVLALTLVYIFAAKMKRLSAQILVSLGLTIGYFAVVLTCNYCWQAMRWNATLGWEPPLYTPIMMAKWGFERYFAHGYPGYHQLLRFMIMACAAIILFIRCRKAAAMRLKQWLVLRAVKTKSAEFALFCYDLTLLFLKRYLNEEELELIKEDYTEIYCDIHSSQLASRFDAAEKCVIDAKTAMEEETSV